MSSYVLITTENRFAGAMARRPLERILLPTHLAQWDSVAKSRVWWAERHGKTVYLRGVVQVSEAQLECEDKTGNQYVAWELSTMHSERITWPGATTQSEASVSNLLGSLAADRVDGTVLTSISEDLEKALECQRNRIGDSVWAFDRAVPRVRKLLERTWRERPPIELGAVSLECAWHYARSYFAREELVGVRNCNPFVVAATTIAGLADLPYLFPWDLDRNSEQADLCNPTDFRALNEDDLSYAEALWTAADRSCGIESLEKASRRHQEILRALAHEVRRQGYDITYNCHVDLRAKREGDEVFFEVKTTTRDNYTRQVREALGQLLEYRHRYDVSGSKHIRLTAVVEAHGSGEDAEFANGLLARHGIVLVECEPATLWSTLRFAGLSALLAGSPTRHGRHNAPLAVQYDVGNCEQVAHIHRP